MDSLWLTSVSLPVRPALSGTVETDVCVVGGGLCGLLTAHFVKAQGLDVVVLEADRAMGGTSGHATGKITCQQGGYDAMIRTHGIKTTRVYAKAQQHAVEQFAQLIKLHAMACDFERVNAHLFLQNGHAQLQKECRAMERLGLDAAMVRTDGVPLPLQESLQTLNQAMFHPVKFAQAIMDDLAVYESSRATSIAPHRVKTQGGQVLCRYVVIATGYPIRNGPGLFSTRMGQDTGYLMALKDTQPLPGMWLEMRPHGLTLRPFGDVQIVGGMGHPTGQHPGPSRFRALRQEALALFPEAHPIARWSTEDCMPTDGLPFVGQYGLWMQGVYVATGFHKWGLTGCMVAARRIAEEIATGKEPQGKRAFTPRRLSKPRIYYKIKGAPKCPHMGCALQWNPDARTWDCPCHGSRFTRSGRVVASPAVRGLDDPKRV